MKKILVLICSLVLLAGCSLSYQIPEIAWQEKKETENTYIDLLKIKDRNSLIIKIGYSSYWSKGENIEFIVYQNNGIVKRFVVYQPNSPEFDEKIQQKRVKRNHYRYYWDFLEKCINENLFQIDSKKLNITQKTTIDEDKRTVESIIVSDGVNYQFQICQAKKVINYESYAPKSYIKEAYPGYEERQQLVDIMNQFKQLTKKY